VTDRMREGAGRNRGFGSDNQAGALPEAMAALVAANEASARAYGADPWTARATARLRERFGAAAEIAFVFGGTGANVVALLAAMAPHEAVLAADCAHLAVDECGAPERIAGCKVIPIAAPGGKLTVAALRPYQAHRGDVHRAQPRVVSISQSTEWGTVYRPEEVRALADFAHAEGMLLHVDGARLANAAAALGVPLETFGRAAGVDLLSLGGTKAGLLFGEAVLVWDPDVAARLPFARKQATQLPSKLRFVAAQFEALLEGDLWLRAAAHANRMAGLLAAALAEMPEVELEHPVEANAIFARVPPSWVEPLAERFLVGVWEKERHLVRMMAAWDTQPEDVEALVAAAQSGFRDVPAPAS